MLTECQRLQKFGTAERHIHTNMYYNGKHYDKISERFIGGKRYYYYRLRFDDIKEVTGDIYLVRTDEPDVIIPAKKDKNGKVGKPTVVKGVKKFKALKNIKSEIKKPTI